MITEHQVNILNNANEALQRAWNAVLTARQGKDPQTIRNAVMRYLQILQQVNIAAETALNRK